MMHLLVKEFKKKFLICVISIVMFSCASYEAKLIEPLQESFVPFPVSSCQSNEGGIQWRLSEGKTEVEGQADWISDHEGGWVFEVVDPWGQIHLSVKHSQLEPLSITPKTGFKSQVKKGFFVINDHKIPIKPNEVACFLEGTIPQTWLIHMWKTPKGSWIYKDGSRKIKISKKKWGWKVKVKWPVLWGLWSQKMIWKIKQDSQSFSKIKVQDYKFEWRNLED
ncbi:MAG: hypothetical protein AB8C84_12410 [Oligoflexales bacterium]